jgi:hypothetical protein
MRTTTKENQARLNAAYESALSAGRINNMQDFADLICKNRSFVASMIGGSTAVSQKTIEQVEAIFEKEGIRIEQTAGTQFNNTGVNNGEQKNGVDPSEIVKTLTNEMAAQREQYAAQFEKLFNMLEREQNTREQLLQRITN